MKRTNLKDLSVDQLVDAFVVIALEQDAAELVDDNAKYRRLFFQMEAVKEELRTRSGDQRRALLPLFTHRNTQVRLKAAKATLAIAPEAARHVLKEIKRWQEFPQALDAGMTLWALEEGTYKPT